MLQGGERRPENLDDCSTIVDVLRSRAQHRAQRRAYTFLLDGETSEASITYLQLDLRARAIAAHLQSHVQPGDRVLLLYPPGLEYLAAFFGCLYAGALAVPAYPPRLHKPSPRLGTLVQDAGAKVALTTPAIRDGLFGKLDEIPDLKSLTWLATEEIPDDQASGWEAPQLTEKNLAFLQYTSGSTSQPKGVMVSHGNLLHNSGLIYNAYEHDENSEVVIWLPPYHDMGLIGGILQPLYAGCHCTLMSPMSFLQRPLRWLQVISRVGGTTSGGPNFAYDLCAQKISDEQKQTLDLSTWKLAFNGSEPVRAQTIDRFSEAFEQCGFRREAFYPCYGLAEGTLMVSGGVVAKPPIIKTVNSAGADGAVAGLETHGDHIRTLVGCGGNLPSQRIAIVDPDTSRECSDGEIGEIWVKGRSMARGYWNNPQATDDVFATRLAGSGDGPYMRTGDMGFLEAGELFITGRLKDIIVVDGRNHYPHDIERTVEGCHALVQSNGTAAFAVDLQGQERLVVLAELDRKTLLRQLKSEPGQSDADAESRKKLDDVLKTIRRAVVEQHDIAVYDVGLLTPGAIPKTTSGKVQRYLCRSNYVNGALDLLNGGNRERD